MTKRKEDINDYITAHDAAQILSEKHDRPIPTGYIAKMTRLKKYTIRTARFRDRIMYHREDIAACTIKQKRSA